jgi:hypothetical protein
MGHFWHIVSGISHISSWPFVRIAIIRHDLPMSTPCRRSPTDRGNALADYSLAILRPTSMQHCGWQKKCGRATKTRLLKAGLTAIQRR